MSAPSRHGAGNTGGSWQPTGVSRIGVGGSLRCGRSRQPGLRPPQPGGRQDSGSLRPSSGPHLFLRHPSEGSLRVGPFDVRPSAARGWLKGSVGAAVEARVRLDVPGVLGKFSSSGFARLIVVQPPGAMRHAPPAPRRGSDVRHRARQAPRPPALAGWLNGGLCLTACAALPALGRDRLTHHRRVGLRPLAQRCARGRGADRRADLSRGVPLAVARAIRAPC